MKVYDFVQKRDELRRPEAPRAERGSTRASTGRTSAPQGADVVQLSHLADEMRAAAIVEEAHHGERLAQLREMIETGRYEVDPTEVAEAILREEILPWIER